MSPATRTEICIVALAEVYRGDGEIVASPIGYLPRLGARLARRTFEPGLLLTDGEASVIDEEGAVEGWLPFRHFFDLVWSGKRHVVMGATQVDRFGNQNISCIGPWARPKVQLLGMRGAPGNTINHPTSYWIPQHSARVLVPKVDVVSGIGWDKAAALGEGGRFVDVRRVVTNLGVFDFETPDRSMRVRSLHPGVSLDEVATATGFELALPEGGPAETRQPTAEELRLIREVLDPEGKREAA